MRIDRVLGLCGSESSAGRPPIQLSSWPLHLPRLCSTLPLPLPLLPSLHPSTPRLSLSLSPPPCPCLRSSYSITRFPGPCPCPYHCPLRLTAASQFGTTEDAAAAGAVYQKVVSPTLSGAHLEDLPGFTRSVVRRDHALITPESQVWAPLPGWSVHHLGAPCPCVLAALAVERIINSMANTLYDVLYHVSVHHGAWLLCGPWGLFFFGAPLSTSTSV